MTAFADYFHFAQDRIEAAGLQTSEKLNAEVAAMREAADHLERRALHLAMAEMSAGVGASDDLVSAAISHSRGML